MKQDIFSFDDEMDMPAGRARAATLQALTKHLWQLSRMDPGALAELLGSEEGDRLLPEVPAEPVASESLLSRRSEVKKASAASLSDVQYRRFLDGEDPYGETHEESTSLGDLERSFNAKNNLEIFWALIDVLIPIGFALFFLFGRAWKDDYNAIMISSIALCLVSIFRSVRTATKYRAEKGQLHYMIERITDMKTTATREAALRRALEKQLAQIRRSHGSDTDASSAAYR